MAKKEAKRKATSQSKRSGRVRQAVHGIGYSNTPQSHIDNSFGISSFNIGLLAFLFSMMLPGFSILLALLGIFFAVKQFNIARSPWAVWGMTFSVAGILISAILIYINGVYG